jgi:uncharacterized protein HemX
MRMTLGMELLMDTTLNLKQTDPQHVLVTRTDEELAHAYEQITRADEQIARADEQLSKLEPTVAWRAGGTRLHWLNVGSGRLRRCHRLAVVLRRCC